MAKPHPNKIILDGTVRSVLTTKGYGFISDTKGVSYFFHRREVPDYDTLRIGSTVQFTPVNSEKGWRADAVVVLEP